MFVRYRSVSFVFKERSKQRRTFRKVWYTQILVGSQGMNFGRTLIRLLRSQKQSLV